jgi:hypothetical protein
MTHKRFYLLILFVLLISRLDAQLSDPGRGMYVDKFFQTTINSSGTPIVDVSRSILTITTKEDALLQY